LRRVALLGSVSVGSEKCGGQLGAAPKLGTPHLRHPQVTSEGPGYAC
jgi:hypothetical protein